MSNKIIKLNYIQVNIKLFTDYKLNVSEAVTYSIINDMQRMNGQATIRQSVLADKLNKGIDLIRKIIKKLVAVGLVSVSRADMYAPNTYICKDIDNESNMYIPLYKSLLSNSDYTLKEKVTYCYLMNIFNNLNTDLKTELLNGKSIEDLQYFNVATKDISDFYNCSVRHARRIINNLIDKGLIEDIKRGFKKGINKIVLKSKYLLGITEDKTPQSYYDNMYDDTITINNNAVKPVTRAVIPTIKDISNTVSNVVQTTVDSVKATVKNKFIPYSDNAIADFINQIKENNNAPVFIQDLE